MNNYNWMPLSEAIRNEHWDHRTPVWYIGYTGKPYIAYLDDLIRPLLSQYCTKDEYSRLTSLKVCRALVPEVPSFEEESK